MLNKWGAVTAFAAFCVVAVAISLLATSCLDGMSGWWK